MRLQGQLRVDVCLLRVQSQEDNLQGIGSSLRYVALVRNRQQKEKVKRLAYQSHDQIEPIRTLVTRVPSRCAHCEEAATVQEMISVGYIRV